MTQEKIIEMAREAGFYNHTPMYFDDEMLVAFYNLLEEKVTARYMQLFLDPENQPTQFGTATQEYRKKEIQEATEEANARANASWTLMCKKMVALEREACAKVCDEVGEHPSLTPQHCAESIRARGEQALAQPEQDGECKYCTHGCAACDARKLQKEAHDLL